MRLVIVGRDLPGRSCPQPGGVLLTNVHVGVQFRQHPVQLVPGDAPDARWELEVEVVTLDDGALDFRGPVVQGKRGERFVYLSWGEVGADQSFQMFRRAKLMLNRIEPALVHDADRAAMQLTASVRLTDDRGCPRCARVDPPAIVWSATAS